MPNRISGFNYQRNRTTRWNQIPKNDATTTQLAVLKKKNEEFKTENEALKREIEELKQKMKSISISQQHQQQQQFGSKSAQSLIYI